MTERWPFREIVGPLRPWPWTDPPETWHQHALRLWTDETDYMAGLLRYMSTLGTWFGGPVLWYDRHVQDGHHRLVVALGLGLGWRDALIPLRPIAAVHPPEELERLCRELAALREGRIPRPPPR